MHTSSRLGLDVVDGSDNVSAYPTVDAQAKGILDNAVTFVSSTLGGLSASLAGRLLRATDTKQWFLDNGSSLDQLLTLGNGFASYHAATTNYTAVAGDWVVANAGVTVTLPSPTTANRLVAIRASGSGVSAASPVTVSGTSIYGVGLSAASSFLLGTPASGVIVQSDGTRWYTIAGEQDTGWVALTLQAGITAFTSVAPAARLRGDRVEFCGVIKNQSAGTLAQFTQIAALPASIPLPPDVVWYTGVNQQAAIQSSEVGLGGTIPSRQIWIGRTWPGNTTWLTGGSVSLEGAAYRL